MEKRKKQLQLIWGMAKELGMSKEDVYDMMLAHLARCQTSLEQYFELDLSIKRVVPYDDLYALSRENAARIAH